MCKAMDDMRNEAAREATFDDRCFKGKEGVKILVSMESKSF